MKKQVLVLAVMMSLTVSVNAMAYEASPQIPAEPGSLGSIAPAGTQVGNKICPVSGHKVGEMGAPVQHEYMGKTYNFCCKMCLKDFDKDPAKYSKIADDEVAKDATATK